MTVRGMVGGEDLVIPMLGLFQFLQHAKECDDCRARFDMDHEGVRSWAFGFCNMHTAPALTTFDELTLFVDRWLDLFAPGAEKLIKPEGHA